MKWMDQPNESIGEGGVGNEERTGCSNEIVIGQAGVIVAVVGLALFGYADVWGNDMEVIQEDGGCKILL